MPKNKNSTDPLDMQDGPTFILTLEPLIETERALTLWPPTQAERLMIGNW